MDAATIKNVFDATKTIAIVGLSDKSERTSYQVAEYLSDFYKIIPVNPKLSSWLGLRSFSSIADIPLDTSVELVNIFRRSEELPAIIEQVIERNQLLTPDQQVKYLWMQPGVLNESAQERAQSENVLVIAEKCIMVEHSHMLGA